MTSLRILDAKRSRDPIERLFGHAEVDLDFCRAKYRVGRIRARTPYGLPGFSFSRASTGYALNGQGLLVAFESGAPRITDRGFLVEGARTNLLLRSQEFDDASWAKTRATVTANAANAPDGTATADKLVEDNTAGASHTIVQSISGNLTTTYTASVYAKAAERSEIQVSLRNNGETIAIGQYFNLATGAVGAAADAGAPTSRLTPTIEALGNGWYRCTVGGVLNSGGGAENVKTRVSLASAGSVSYNGDNVSGAYLWGGQTEAAQGASSYIPTTTASATRAADVSSLACSASAPITIYAEGEFAALLSASQYLTTLHNGAALEFYQIVATTTPELSANMLSGGVVQGPGAAGITGGLSRGAVLKAACRFAANDMLLAKNGALGTPDTSGTAPTASSTLTLGGYVTGASPMFGYLRRLVVFPRALSGPELQAISA